MVAAKFERKLTFDSNSSGQLSGGFVYPLLFLRPCSAVL